MLMKCCKYFVFAIAFTTIVTADIFAQTAADAHRPQQMAALTISSLSSVNDALYSGLSGIGSVDSKDATDDILQWLFMVPSLSCADKTREATVCLLTPKNAFDIPDKAAVLPLAPIGGAYQLVSELRQTYSTITGTNLLFCSDPIDSNKVSNICLYLTKNTALIANNKESLVWLARQFRNKSLPSIKPVRNRAPIAITFDGKLCHEFLSILVPSNDVAYGLPYYLMLLKEILSTVESADISIEPDAIDWRIALRLNYPNNTMSAFEGKASIKNSALSNEFHIFSHCQSVSFLPLIFDILPNSILKKFNCGINSIYNAAHILPAMPAADKEIKPYLTGERASAIITSTHDNLLGKIEIFPVNDTAKLAETLKKIKFPLDTVKRQADRQAYGTTIYKYTINAITSEIDSKGSFIAHALSMLYSLENIEFAISGSNLYVASGSKGLIDNWLKKVGFPRKEKSQFAFSQQTPSEIPLGGGIQDISSLIDTLAKSTEQLKPISKDLPHPGSGIQWQISRSKNSVVFDILASSSEILALKVMSNIDTEKIRSLILEKASMQR